jgi:preprotein translocase subunit YajC
MPQPYFILIFLLILAVPLILGTRKQKRAAQEHQKLLGELAPGDRVMTTSGLYGTVVNAESDTTIDLEIAPGVVTTWFRSVVREKVAPEVPEAEASDEISELAELDGQHEAIAAEEAPEPEAVKAPEAEKAENNSK